MVFTMGYVPEVYACWRFNVLWQSSVVFTTFWMFFAIPYLTIWSFLVDCIGLISFYYGLISIETLCNEQIC